ncbi:MAG: nuclear transport factor 2 family protein [Bryobacteraceae bacterium]
MAAAETIPSQDPVSVVRKYIDAFNKGDVNGLASSFVVPGNILDGMAPHVWSGLTATQDWYRDALAEAEHLDVKGYFVTLGEPSHNNVTGDAAYVVLPATMTFKVKGEEVTQSGAKLTVALRRVEGAWRIASWAWTKGSGGGIGDVG